jgi:hypothetical protein
MGNNTVEEDAFLQRRRGVNQKNEYRKLVFDLKHDPNLNSIEKYCNK